MLYLPLTYRGPARAVTAGADLAMLASSQTAVALQVTAPARIDEPSVAQHLQVMRDRRLREIEGGVQVADAALVRSGEAIDDSDACRIGERLEARSVRLALSGSEHLDAGAAAEHRQGGDCLHRGISI